MLNRRRRTDCEFGLSPVSRTRLAIEKPGVEEPDLMAKLAQPRAPRFSDVLFVQKQADIACIFFEQVLKHTADEWWGKPFFWRHGKRKPQAQSSADFPGLGFVDKFSCRQAATEIGAGAVA
jgi:hypothetical protein